MRASKWIALLAVALWISAVLAHAVAVSMPSLWLTSSQGYRILLQALNAAPGRCRIILVGSSPVVVGLSAATLQNATGCVTVNAGQNSVGHELNLYLDLVLARARPGDWVVLGDRQWTKPLDRHHACEQDWPSECLNRLLRVAPYLNDDLGRFLGTGFLRTPQGDLIEYPRIAPQRGIDQTIELNDIAYRLERIERQVQAIRAAGARPLLVAVPIFVPESARPRFERQLAMLSAEVQKAFGPEIWLAPGNYAEPALFSGDGAHLSEAGRRRWTAEVLRALPLRP